MKMNNRMNIKNIIKIFGIAVSVVCVLGCADLNKGKEQIENEDSYLLTGKISLPAESVAVPSLLNAVINNAGNSTGDSSARTATSTFTQTTNQLNGDFTVTATHTITETGEVITRTCTVQTTEGSMTYTLRLPYTGEWTLEAKIFGYIDDNPSTPGDESTTDSIAYLVGQTTINITEEASTLSKDIAVSPTFATNTNGQIKLPVTDETETVHSIKLFEYETDLDGREVMASTPSLDTTFNGPLYYIQGEFPAGSHKVTIYFYDSEDKEVYSCTESLVVYSGFVTDCWYGKGSHLHRNPDSEMCDFVLDEDLLASYIRRGDISIKNSEDGLDTPYLLWSTTTSEFDGIEGGTSEKTGIQIVGSLGTETTINHPFANITYNRPVFCFGNNGYLYVLQDKGNTSNGVINAYKESYAGYVLDKSIDLTTSYSGIQSVLSYKDGYLFFVGSAQDSNWNYTYYLYIWDIENDTLLVPNRVEIPKVVTDGGEFNASAGISIQLQENSEQEGNKQGVLYYGTSNSNENISYSIVKQPFTVTLNEGTYSLEFSAATSTASYSLKNDNLGVYSVVNRFSVSDMLIQDNVLYVLCNAYAKSEDAYFKTGGTDDQPVYASKTLYTSNGGVLKFNLTDTDFTPSRWGETEDAPLVLGLYSENDNKEYYERNWDGSSYSALNWTEKDGVKIIKPVINQPPLDEADFYFYGPQKFVAIKPKELVIADDGAYFADSKIYSKNRVVKVSLEEESLGEMDVTDVNVTFTKKLTSCGSVYID